MARLIFWLAIVAGLIIAWRRVQARSTRRTKPTATQRAQPMRVCARCGVHVPQSLAVRQGERWYCEAAHVPLE